MAMPDANSKSLAERRERCVADQIEARGVRDPLVLAAMRKVPRECFVSAELAYDAYEDRPVPIGWEQTISQPYIVAFMIEALALRGGERVLEIGAGSGYASAVVAEIAGEVFAMERIAELAELAAANLEKAQYKNVHVQQGDGTEGWACEAPFDAILVSAGAPGIPDALKRQLADGGKMVVPVGNDPGMQELVRVTRTGDAFKSETIAAVRFVPLIGREGWPAGAVERSSLQQRLARAREGVARIAKQIRPRNGSGNPK